MGWALRTTLPTGKGGVVHLFVVYGYQEAEQDADQLFLTDKLLQAVPAEAQVVCIGQPTLIAGDLNADLVVIPCLAEGISACRFVDLALAYSRGAGLTLDVTRRFCREEGTGSRRDFFVGCPNAFAASEACFVTDLCFTLHFSVVARLRIDAWMADVACPFVCRPIWPACFWILLISPPRRLPVLFRMSGMFMGMNLRWVVLALRGTVSWSSVDEFWSIWSRNAEAGIFRACSQAGGPTEAGSSAFLGRGLFRIRNRRLGGRAAGGKSSSRLYCVSYGDEVDVHCAQYFIHSSLCPVLLFRRRLKSVADVLKGIKNKGFTQTRWDALLRYWCAVCRHGPCGPISPLHPWCNWVPPDLHGFNKWVFDSLEVLSNFLKQVVVLRRDIGIRKLGGFGKI